MPMSATKGRKETLADRIKGAMPLAGIESSSELARRMKLNRQTVHRWVSGAGDKLTPEMLFRLADALKVSARWLALGSPELPTKPIFPTIDEAEMFSIYRALPKNARDHWLSQGRTLVQMLRPGSVNSPFPAKT